MTSQIDPNVIVDNERVDKADLREQLQIAKNEISALQQRNSPVREMAFGDDPFVEGESADVLQRANNLSDVQNIQTALLNLRGVRFYSTLAEAKSGDARPDVVYVKCKSTFGDGWEGAFLWHSGASDTADDALVWTPTAGSELGRYKRAYFGEMFGSWFSVETGTTSDQSTKLQAAVTAAEANLCGTVRLQAGNIRLDNTVYLGREAPVMLVGIDTSHRYLSFANNPQTDVTVLYCENLPVGDDAIVMASALQTDEETRDFIGIENIVIARNTPATPGDGGRGVLLKGVINPHMSRVLIYGFDVGIYLGTNEGGKRATFLGKFNEVSTKQNGTYGVHAESMIECTWDRCAFHGATNYGFYISKPAVPEPGYNVISNGNFFNDCTFLGSQGTVPIHNVYIDAGFFHKFEGCAFEESTDVGLKCVVGTAGGHSASRHAVVMADCWFNNAGGDGNAAFDDCSFAITTTRFETGASSTNAPVRVGLASALGLGTYGSSMTGCSFYYQSICGLNVDNYDCLKVSDCTFYDKSASGLPGIITSSSSARNIFSSSTIRTTHARGYVDNAAIGNGNIFSDMLLSSANTISDSNYRRANGGAWRSIGGNNSRTLWTGISQADAGMAWSRYSNDTGGVFHVYFKSRGATDGVRGAVSSGDSIKIDRHYLDDSTNDVEVVRETRSADGLTGGAWEIATKASSGSLTRKLKVDGPGNVEIGAGTLATNATDGFAYVPTCAGTPTGTPTTKTGYVPIVVNITNNKLYFYSGGAWRDAGP